MRKRRSAPSLNPEQQRDFESLHCRVYSHWASYKCREAIAYLPRLPVRDRS